MSKPRPVAHPGQLQGSAESSPSQGPGFQVLPPKLRLLPSMVTFHVPIARGLARGLGGILPRLPPNSLCTFPS